MRRTCSVFVIRTGRTYRSWLDGKCVLDLPDRVLQLGVPVEAVRSAVEDALRRVQNRGNIPIDHRILHRQMPC